MAAGSTQTPGRVLRGKRERQVASDRGRWASRRGDRSVGRQTEVPQDALDDGRVFDGGDEAEPGATDAREDVDFEHPAHQVGPEPSAT